MMRFMNSLAALALCAVAAVPLQAQHAGPPPRDPAGPPMRMRMQGGPPGSPQSPERQQLQQRIRQAFTRAVRERVGLSDDQMQRLAPINHKYQQQRQALAREERATRESLREELASASPDAAKVQQMSAQLQDFQRQRVDLNDAEQKELGDVMSPVQLARYRAMQEQFQRRMNEMRRQRQAPGDTIPPSR
jgi:hypothetical protein